MGVHHCRRVQPLPDLVRARCHGVVNAEDHLVVDQPYRGRNLLRFTQSFLFVNIQAFVDVFSLLLQSQLSGEKDTVVLPRVRLGKPMGEQEVAVGPERCP